MKFYLIIFFAIISTLINAQTLSINQYNSVVNCNGTLYMAGNNNKPVPYGYNCKIPHNITNNINAGSILKADSILLISSTDGLLYLITYNPLTFEPNYIAHPYITNVVQLQYNYFLRSDGFLWEDYTGFNFIDISFSALPNTSKTNIDSTKYFTYEKRDETCTFTQLKTDSTIWTDNDAGILDKKDLKPLNIANKIVKLVSSFSYINSLSSNNLYIPSSYAALDNKGNIWCWGDNKYGLLGFGTTTPIIAPSINSNIPKLKNIFMGLTCAMGIDSLNNVWVWGSLFDKPANALPYKLTELNNITEIAIGIDNYMAKDNNNSVFTWGNNKNGVLANGTFNNLAKPTGSLFCNPKPLANCSTLHPNDIEIDTVLNYNTQPALMAPEGLLYNWNNNGLNELNCYSCRTPICKNNKNNSQTVTVLDTNYCNYKVNFNLKFILCDSISEKKYSVPIIKDTIVKPNTGVILKLPTNNTYSWNNTDLLSCNNCSQPVAVVNYSTTFKLSTTDPYNCPITHQINVKVRNCDTIQKPVTFLKLDTSVTPGSSVKLTASNSYKYNWLSNAYVNCSTCQSNAVTAYYTDTFKVELLDKWDCPYYEKFKVKIRNCDTILPPITIIKLDTVIKPGAVIKLKADKSNVYHWENLSTQPCINCSEITDTASISKTYIVKLLGKSNCPFYNAFYVKLRKCDTIVKPNIVILDTFVYENEYVKLYAGASIADYIWDYKPNLSCFECKNPTVKVFKTDTFSITVTNNWLCNTKQHFIIKCKYYNDSIVPNIISPNNDGINDYFFVPNLTENTRLQIFNLKSELVFIDNNYNNQFYGTDSHNNTLPDGTYWYVINIPDTKQIIKGFIYIKR